jgi:hypothetical protein
MLARACAHSGAARRSAPADHPKGDRRPPGHATSPGAREGGGGRRVERAVLGSLRASRRSRASGGRSRTGSCRP